MIISSNLRFTVTTPGRPAASGVVRADGAHVTVETSDPVAVWDGAVGSIATGPAALRTAADQLTGQGVTVSVTGPRGRVATVGAGVDSALGRVLTGSARVSLGSPRAVAPLARAQLLRWVRAPSARRRVVLAGLGGCGLVVVGRRLRGAAGSRRG